MFRSALLILSGNAAASLLLLIRNLLVARLISVEDYGIAATYAIAMAVVEMASALGLQQQIVQSKEGDDPRFQRALQGFQVLRGVIAGGILFLAAGWIADFLHVPHLAWAYQLIALVPVMTALQHFDIHRLNRQMRFWPIVLTGAVPALVSLAAVWPLDIWFGDHRVMLYAILIQFGLMLVVSHLVAERRYGLVLDLGVMRRSLAFGWPLLVNGILLFAVFQGDKLIVGRELGLEVLAILAMGITLTLTPTLVMAKSAQNFFLPQLSRMERGSAAFAAMSTVIVEAALLMGLVLVVAIMLFGPPLVTLVLGAKYAALIPLLTWLAIAQAVRVFKAGPAIIAMAAGQNESAMFANLARIMVLPLAWWVAVTTGELLPIIAVGILGEVLGQLVALGLLYRRTGLALGPMILPHLAASLTLLAAGLYAARAMVWPETGSGVATLAVVLVFLGAMVAFPALRGYVGRRRTQADPRP